MKKLKPNEKLISKDRNKNLFKNISILFSNEKKKSIYNLIFLHNYLIKDMINQERIIN